MITSSAALVHRHRWPLVVVGIGLLATAATLGPGVERRLSVGGFEDPRSESTRAAVLLNRHFGIGPPDVAVVYRARGTPKAFAESLAAPLDELRRHPGVLQVSTSAGAHPDALISADGRIIVVTIQLRGTDTEREQVYRQIAPRIRRSHPGVLIGGVVPGRVEVEKIAGRDLLRAELILLPLLALALIWIFRGVIAALLPLLVGAFSVLGALGVLRVLVVFIDVSIFAMNIAAFIGLGLAVDYSLFIVTRFREERDRGAAPSQAVVRTLQTAGRTVLFSGIAVIVSLLMLLVFPIMALRSVAIAGSLVVLLTLVATLLFLPAALAILGPRIEWLSARRGRRSDSDQGLWTGIANLVMRHPVYVSVTVSVVLLAAGLPFIRMHSATSDARVLPPRSEARQVQELLETPGVFPPNELTPMIAAVALDRPVLTPGGVGTLYDYVETLKSIPGVRRVASVVSSGPRLSRDTLQVALPVLGAATSPLRRDLARGAKGRWAVVAIFSQHAPSTTAAAQQLAKVRSVVIPGGRAWVGGETSRLVDLKQSLRSRWPLALVLIGVTSFIVIFFAFGSLVLPVKAILMNVLSLAASFGVLVYVFQDGRLEGLLGYSSTGTIDITVPIVMFAVLFGLSMDYELFLLSRIREEHERTGDPRAAVGVGLQRTGTIITSAAALLILVMAGFASAELLIIKQLGVGMAVAIALDATIVRALLVPATMELLGKYNWWAPAALQRWWSRLVHGLDER